MLDREVVRIDLVAIDDVGLLVVQAQQFRVADDAVRRTAKIVTGISCSQQGCFANFENPVPSRIVQSNQFRHRHDTVTGVGSRQCRDQVIFDDIQLAACNECIDVIGIEIS